MSRENTFSSREILLHGAMLEVQKRIIIMTFLVFHEVLVRS